MLGTAGSDRFAATIGLGLLDTPMARKALMVAAARARHPAIRKLARRCLEIPAPLAVVELLQDRSLGRLDVAAIEILRHMHDPAILPALDELRAHSRAATFIAKRIRRIAARRASATSAPARGGS